MIDGKHPDAVGTTLAYYDQHADAFVERTAHLSMEHVYEPFLALVPRGGRILDAGCGSGRDAAEFAKRGYRMTAFDGSPQMAERAAARTGFEVLTMTFEAVDWQGEFDGVWASASLLHLPAESLRSAVSRLVQALRPDGVLFVSMKEGEFQGEREERWFTDTTPGALRALMTANGLDVVNIWSTDDQRPGVTRRWINGLGRRRAESVQVNRLEESQLEVFLFGTSRIPTARVRAGLWEIQEKRYFYCHARIADPAGAEVDHFVPWARYADDGLDNLVVADTVCNGSKSSSLAADAHLSRWTRRFAQGSKECDAFTQLAAKARWIRDPGRSLSVARAIYPRLPHDARLWLRGREFVPPDTSVIAGALAVQTAC